MIDHLGRHKCNNAGIFDNQICGQGCHSVFLKHWVKCRKAGVTYLKSVNENFYKIHGKIYFFALYELAILSPILLISLEWTKLSNWYGDEKKNNFYDDRKETNDKKY